MALYSYCSGMHCSLIARHEPSCMAAAAACTTGTCSVRSELSTKNGEGDHMKGNAATQQLVAMASCRCSFNYYANSSSTQCAMPAGLSRRRRPVVVACIRFAAILRIEQSIHSVDMQRLCTYTHCSNCHHWHSTPLLYRSAVEQTRPFSCSFLCSSSSNSHYTVK